MVLVTLLGLALFAVLLTALADRAIMPAVITIANQRSVAIINDVINESLITTIHQFGLVSEDFYNMTEDAEGQLASLSVDTILINQVAALLAVDISRQLSIDAPTLISVPIGMLTGIPMLASLGPEIAVNIVPTGEARVEYETSFTSAGINQINFQVWLTVETQMRIVVPLTEDIIPVTRRVPLVNTVFAGTVPEGMILTDFGFN
jgi:sporulation protein YunB